MTYELEVPHTAGPPRRRDSVVIPSAQPHGKRGRGAIPSRCMNRPFARQVTFWADAEPVPGPSHASEVVLASLGPGTVRRPGRDHGYTGTLWDKAASLPAGSLDSPVAGGGLRLAAGTRASGALGFARTWELTRLLQPQSQISTGAGYGRGLTVGERRSSRRAESDTLIPMERNLASGMAPSGGAKPP